MSDLSAAQQRAIDLAAEAVTPEPPLVEKVDELDTRVTALETLDQTRNA